MEKPGRAVVTGASSGIGEAFARELAARGWSLVLVARREDRLERIAAELGGPARAVVLPADLSRPGEAQRVFDVVEGAGLEVDLLVNNAGVGDTGPFVKEPLDRIAAMIDLNVRALTELTRLWLAPMLRRGRGTVVNVVSTSAFQPVPFLAVYAASKAYVLSLTEALEFELAGSGVRVQALCPGLTATEFQQVAGTDHVAFNQSRSATPAEVARFSIDNLGRGGARAIHGWQNRLMVGAQAFVPRGIVRRVAAEMFRPAPPARPDGAERS